MHQVDNEDHVSFGEWVGSLLLMLIPIIGLIALIRWAFSTRTKISKRNYARAMLLVQLPGVIVLVGLSAAMAIPAFQKVRDSSRARAAASSMDADPEVATLDQVRTYQSTDGRTIEAAVLGFSGEQVRIRRTDGHVFMIDMTRFIPADIAYLKRLRDATDTPATKSPF